jgi:predicted transcriptional regulator
MVQRKHQSDYKTNKNYYIYNKKIKENIDMAFKLFVKKVKKLLKAFS